LKNKIKKGLRKPRVKRPVEKNLVEGYDSNWEYELHTGILDSWKFHVDKINYIVEHSYEPDFTKVIGAKTILLEAKGRFWDYSEYSKYVWIKKVLPENKELVFLFANPNAPMPQAKRRKDGTKRSHGEWATANGFKWFSEDSIPSAWINTEKRESFNVE
tara:strand:+ start:1262 stop:1738 length:477 start_codon:yes stop_codon:yes gene_type:complete